MDLSYQAQALAAIMVFVVALWVTEALPLPISALLGVAACVVSGVAPMNEAFRAFSQPLIFLFIGSFMLAEAIRVHGLDRRLAYAVLGMRWIQGRPTRILAAVAFVSALVSAFISNTATTAMMVSIVAGMLAAIEEADRTSEQQLSPDFATGLFLCVAYAASIGGLATPIGTPPNVIGLTFIRQELNVDITFFGWCAIGFPIAASLVTVAVILLSRLFPAHVQQVKGLDALVSEEQAKQGPWSRAQKSTAVAFGVTVTLWVIPGVIALLCGQEYFLYKWFKLHIPEGLAALCGAILLFILPGNTRADGSCLRVLEWHEAAGIDWGVILLYGGGMALGEMAFSTGLAEWIGLNLTGWLPPGGGVPLLAMAAVVAVACSEFTSNTASATMVVPVAIALARATGGDPLLPAIAATFAASLGFMMPVSTPCNAIVYGTGRISLRAMIRGGVIIDVIGAILVTAAVLVMGYFLTNEKQLPAQNPPSMTAPQ
ncbi:MAG: DASS family sodium-coupled anion symporter [Pirellulales bacterium]